VNGFNESTRLVPDVVRGVRGWKIHPDGKHLMSVAQPYRWRPGWNDAVCYAIYPPAAEWMTHLGSPNGRLCGCGFWAYWSTHGPYVSTAEVAGIIEGKGRAVVGSAGFRIEQARIVALVDPEVAVRTRFPGMGPIGWILPIWCAAWALYNVTLLVLALTGAGHGSPWTYAVLTVGFSVLAALFVVFRRRGAHKVSKYYPDVPVYPSWKAALKDFPVEKPTWKK
jgi:hypothetical protein